MRNVPRIANQLHRATTRLYQPHLGYTEPQPSYTVPQVLALKKTMRVEDGSLVNSFQKFDAIMPIMLDGEQSVAPGNSLSAGSSDPLDFARSGIIIPTRRLLPTIDNYTPVENGVISDRQSELGALVYKAKRGKVEVEHIIKYWNKDVIDPIRVHSGTQDPQRTMPLELARELVGKVMNSPYIVKLYDGGDVPGGGFFLAFEVVHGPNLVDYTEHLVRRHLMVGNYDDFFKGLAWSLKGLEDCAMGLRHAHLLGIIHRDIKPTNLLLSQVEVESDDGNGGSSVKFFGKVSDFGSAAVVQAVGDITKKSSVLEQIERIDEALRLRGFSWRGAAQYTDPDVHLNMKPQVQHDVYGLAATLYFCASYCTPGIDPIRFREDKFISATRSARSLIEVFEARGEFPSHAHFGKVLDKPLISIKGRRRQMTFRQWLTDADEVFRRGVARADDPTRIRRAVEFEADLKQLKRPFFPTDR